MIHGSLFALASAFVDGFLEVSYDIAAKGHYQIWDVILYMQFTGFMIGLAVTMFAGLLFYNLRLLSMGLVGAMTFVGRCGLLPSGVANAILPPTEGL